MAHRSSGRWIQRIRTVTLGINLCFMSTRLKFLISAALYRKHNIMQQCSRIFQGLCWIMHIHGVNRLFQAFHFFLQFIVSRESVPDCPSHNLEMLLSVKFARAILQHSSDLVPGKAQEDVQTHRHFTTSAECVNSENCKSKKISALLGNIFFVII